jgi:hypothetical protein
MRRHGQARALERDLFAERRALAALDAVNADRAPAALRARVALIRLTACRQRARARHRPARRPIIRVAAALATAGLAAPLILLVDGGAVPSVAQAVALGIKPAVARVHEPPDGRVTLPRVRGAGLSFPYWEDRFGWRAIGVRRDHVDGRTLTTVLYMRGRSGVAYTIVSGPALPDLAGARAIVRAGTRLHSFTLGDRRVVTWLRRGHTCVLSGANIPAAELAALGSWRGGGAIPY